MTAIATVLAHLRLARLTPYLLAVLAAVAACLLLGIHTAIASERPGSHLAKPQLETGAAHELEQAHQARPEEKGAPAPRQQAARIDRPTELPPVAVPLSDRPVHRQPAAERATVAAGPRHGSPPPPVTTLPAAAVVPATTLTSAAQPRHPDALPVRQVQAPPVARAQTEAPTTTPTSTARSAATTAHHTRRVLLSGPEPQERGGPEKADQGESASELQRTSRDDQRPAATAPAPESVPSAASQPTPQAACLPPAEEGRQPVAAQPQVQRGVLHGTAAGLVPHPRNSFVRTLRQPGIALVATPSEALAAVLAMGRPAIELPRVALPPSASVLPVNPPVPFQPTQPAPVASVPSAAHQAVLRGNPLMGRLESAVTLGALWLLVPLLAVVLLFQVRLMRQMRALTARPAEPATRYYSLTHQEARDLAPDMQPALAHHRFCETERHQGRWRPASWLELEDTGSEPLLMWATCDTCHHQRMTRLRSGREVAVSRP